MTTESQKRANIKWRALNRLQYNESSKIYNLKYNNANRKKKNEKSNVAYHIKRESNYEVIKKIFLKILR